MKSFSFSCTALAYRSVDIGSYIDQCISFRTESYIHLYPGCLSIGEKRQAKTVWVIELVVGIFIRQTLTATQVPKIH